MPPDRQRPDRGPRNSSWQRTKRQLPLAIAFERHTGDRTISLVSTPILREGTWVWSHHSSFSANPTRGLAARQLFIVLPCREGTIHLQTSMSSPGFEPRAYGTAVSVANHYTG
ncbi:hypothetical protein TNCV_3322791 [Trichonephila clavipes]|nr:hypothetical protein TNCV_3322791 [Trichonephila clavipes]